MSSPPLPPSLTKNKMNTESFFSSSFFFLFFSVILFNSHHVQAQPSTTGYNCTANQTSKPCSTYVYYRGEPPDFLNLANISDLFNLGRPTIAELSNLSSVSAPLLPEQSLLIPITCSCNSNLNYSYANFTYKIKGGDTFYLVSTTKFQNLTTYQAVELVNPTLIPERLDIGVDVIFPVFCKCPDQNQLQQNQAKFLITYVFQPSDNFSSIANKFGADLRTLTAINKRDVSPYETVFVPVLQLPNFTQPVVSSTNNGSTATGPSGQVTVRNDRKGVVTGLGIGLGITGFLLVSLILVMCLWVSRESKKKKGGIRTGSGVGKRKQGYEFAKPFSAKEEMGLMADVSDCLDKYKVYGIEEVREATADFDSSCLIHGSVYKGFMGGVYYAIKRMKWNAYEELKILQKVNHGNLVKLEGFCIDPEDGNCYLVYEYVENGSLHSWLHGDQMSRRKLDWKTRLRIAIDVANALQYIHEHTRPTVVHKDIKTSNILLDGNMRAKVANFGLARSGCNAITMHIVGTQGYISPEYLVDGVVTTKMDVFAFGVVLLELLSGKEAINEEGRVLWASAERVFSGTDNEKHQQLKEWMDEVLAEDNSCMDGVMSVMAVALACLQKDPSKRPNMVEVVYTLCKTNDLYSDFSEDGLSVTSVSAR